MSFEYYMFKKKEKNMKRKTKAALSLFLAALALLAVFTSCKPDSPPPQMMF